jgi:YgiT-type zinc finger domain-containing protein
MKHTIKCPQCDGSMHLEQKKAFPYSTSAGVVTVPQMQIMVCPQCKEIVIPDTEVRRAEGLLARKILHKKVLDANDYGFLLHFLELSAQEAAELFEKDKSTMSRWLSGKTPMDPLVKKLILEMAREAAEGNHTLREVLNRAI